MSDDLFDWAESGEALKEAGMAKVHGNTTEDWKAAFSEAGSALAATGNPFTSEDITTRCGQPPPGTSPNAVGAMMSGLAKRLKLRIVGHVKARRPNQHATIISQWQ